jgi:integrase
MASIARDPKGRKRVLFVADDGKRKVIRLGKCSLHKAERFKSRLEDVLTSRHLGHLDPDTAAWLADLPGEMQVRLAAVGLVKLCAGAQNLTLGELLSRYIESRADIKPGTLLVLRQAQQSLLGHFGSDKLIREIHEGDAELWRLSMVQQGLADATIRKRSGNAKQFFAFAIRHRLTSSNPFSGLKSSARANEKRLHFVSLQDTQKMLNACSDTEWRLIIALCRFAGLRCPSEVLGLQWQDVNWEQSRILVHSPKTEHHVGGESRVVPIFAELLPYLREAFEQAEPGATYCIARYRQANCNLRTQAHRIIRRAGLKPWPRTFQNLRASRETELTESFPLHVVTSWLGNTQSVAMRHYLSVREEDFTRAAQNPARTDAELTRMERKPTLEEARENADLQVCAGSCDSMRHTLLAPRGFEPLSPG